MLQNKTRRKKSTNSFKNGIVRSIYKRKCKELKITAASTEIKRNEAKLSQTINEIYPNSGSSWSGSESESELSDFSSVSTHNNTKFFHKQQAKSHKSRANENNSLEPTQEIALSKLLLTIDQLSGANGHNEVAECAENMQLDSHIYWGSPTPILRALKNCFLKRDWNNITHLLLLLLNQKSYYVPFVISVCKFVGKFNPLVKENGLTEQFELLCRETKVENSEEEVDENNKNLINSQDKNGAVEKVFAQIDIIKGENEESDMEIMEIL